MSTIYDVSKLAGVSLATVSRVMNGSSPVREKTRAKVMQAMNNLGYQPNAMAKALASSRSFSVGILVSEFHGPFFGSMMSTIEAELRKCDVHAIIAAGHNSKSGEQEALKFLQAKRCDALIVFAECVSDKYLIDIHESGTPIAVLSRDIKKISDKCFSVDNCHGGYLATNHLIEHGHSSIAYISGPLKNKIARQRYEGHLRALATKGLDQSINLIYEGNFREDSGEQGLKQLLKDNTRFTALACANDEMAIGAMEAARNTGLRLPNDLSIIGFDNIHYCQYVQPKLTTVQYPIEQIAQAAAQSLLCLVYGKDCSPEHNRFELCLVQRESVVAPKT